jgi:hypothetical protein
MSGVQADALAIAPMRQCLEKKPQGERTRSNLPVKPTWDGETDPASRDVAPRAISVVRRSIEAAACVSARGVFLKAASRRSASKASRAVRLRRFSTHTIRSRHAPEIHDTAWKNFSHPRHQARDSRCGLVISY